MVKPRSALVRALLLVCLTALCAGAGGKEGGGGFWGELAHPGQRAFAAAIKRGVTIFNSAIRLRNPSLRDRTLGDALAAFRVAVKASPKNAEGHFWVGNVAYYRQQMKLAIASYLKARRLNPRSSHRLKIASSLGIAYAKLGRFVASVGEYDRALRLADKKYRGYSSALDKALFAANAAESLMAVGRLDEAIQRYRQSLDFRASYRLARWGLAVALDRDEQGGKALKEAKKAIAGDAAMKALTAESTFFVPDGDIHYYFALGYMAQGKTKQARRQWEAFLRKLPRSKWAFRARAQLSALKKANRIGRRRRLAPRPKITARPYYGMSRDRNAIRTRMRGRFRGVQACYEKELKRRATLAGRMVVAFTVTPTGAVSKISVRSSTLRRPSLGRCVINVIRKTRFTRPRSGRAVTMIFPFDFKPS